MSGNGEVRVLPSEIIHHEILCRLPATSLLRFKSVCKLWCSVIKDPKFIATHYRHQNQSNHNRTGLLIKEQEQEQEQGSSDRSGNPLVVKPVSDESPIGNLDEIEGKSFFSYYLGIPKCSIFLFPVNGFVLLLHLNKQLDHCRMAILNPATRQFRYLIDFEFNCDYDYDDVLENHLFGYGICNHSTKDGTTDPLYKVVWLNRPPNWDLAFAKMFSFKLSGGDGDGGDDDGVGWRIINTNVPIRFVYDYPLAAYMTTSMNDKCYWLSRDFARVLEFDMVKEEFREMGSSQQPRRGMLHSNAALSQVPTGGGGNSLAVFVFEPDYLDMSVMDEEEWHWTRRLVPYVHRSIDQRFLKPVMYCPEFHTGDSVTLKAGLNSFAWYNPKINKCMRVRESSNRYCYSNLLVFNFNESLFSVDGGVEVSDRVLEEFCTF